MEVLKLTANSDLRSSTLTLEVVSCLNAPIISSSFFVPDTFSYCCSIVNKYVRLQILLPLDQYCYECYRHNQILIYLQASFETAYAGLRLDVSSSLELDASSEPKYISPQYYFSITLPFYNIISPQYFYLIIISCLLLSLK